MCVRSMMAGRAALDTRIHNGQAEDSPYIACTMGDVTDTGEVKMEKLRGIPRIELGTSCTQSRNHTTRPNTLRLHW